MYQGDNRHYFDVGYSALRCIRLALAVAEKGEVRRILDLPCGHGRVLRMLRAAFPQAELTACDLDRDGVDFCASHFGAVPVYSAERPDQIPLQGPYDLIWCGSLFTHLDVDRWPGFLDAFRSHLGPGGVAVFTTHGRRVAQRLREGRSTYGLTADQVAQMLRDYDRSGFGYARQPSPQGGDWGLSLSRPSWVLSHLEPRPDLDILLCAEQAWDDHHDVIAFKML
ncbi:MAG: class I SAM-dependent methyltransferase [Isosphaeraceae bacterium]|nr:class I SAM-dependent methyltransferase [Isosphaeraceae bacterium]